MLAGWGSCCDSVCPLYKVTINSTVERNAGYAGGTIILTKCLTQEFLAMVFSTISIFLSSKNSESNVKACQFKEVNKHFGIKKLNVSFPTNRVI